MVTNVVSPFTTNSATPLAAPPPAVAAEASPSMPQDLVATSEAPSGLSGLQKAGVALMTGVALVGGGLLTPASAQAHDLRAPMVHSRVMPMGHNYGHHHGGNAAGAIVGGIIGGIIGGAIANGGVYVPPQYPAPMPYPVPVPVPVPVTPGYNAVGADGVYHHFDQYGHVADRSGHYNLSPGMYGGYVVTPAPPHY